MNSSPTNNNYKNQNNSSNLPTPCMYNISDGLLVDDFTKQNGISPFIKRKSLNKQKCYNKIQASLMFDSNSPYLISSKNLHLTDHIIESPKTLNDRYIFVKLFKCHLKNKKINSFSFETIKMVNIDTESKMTSKLLSRRRSIFSKHKSAPLANLTQHFNNIQTIAAVASPNNSSTLKPISTTSLHQPLNDISNHINQKLTTNSLNQINSFKQNSINIEETTSLNELIDDETDLENLIFGNNNNNFNINNSNLIKQSLEFDAQFKNLIGDRSRIHILPATQSNKHPDLFCISPETVIFLINF
jgi:hypothetical protein